MPSPIINSTWSPRKSWLRIPLCSNHPSTTRGEMEGHDRRPRCAVNLLGEVVRFPSPPGSPDEAEWSETQEEPDVTLVATPPALPPTIESYQAGKAYIDELLLQETEAWAKTYVGKMETAMSEGEEFNTSTWLRSEFRLLTTQTVYHTLDIVYASSTECRHPPAATTEEYYLIPINPSFGYQEPIDEQGWGVLWFQRQHSGTGEFINRILAVIYSFWPEQHKRTGRVATMAEWFLAATNPESEIHLQINCDDGLPGSHEQDDRGTAVYAASLANAIAARYPEIPTHITEEEDLTFAPSSSTAAEV